MAADPVDPAVLARAGPQRAADPPASRARRPGRDAEVRLRRRPADPGAGRARETAARVALGAYAQGASWRRRSASRPGQPRRRPSARVAAPAGAPLPEPGDVDADRRRPGALPRPGDGGVRWSPRSTRPSRTATPSAASSRSSCTACRRASAATCTGTAGSTPAWPAALMGIQAIKGVEVGDGFDRRAGRAAPQAHDEIVRDGRRRCAGVTGRSGGTEGGMTHRRGAAGARGDEADLDRAARACAPSTCATGEAGRRPSTSAPTSARCRPPASSPRRWWPWCWPTRRWRSSAGTRSPRPGATRAATWTTLDSLLPCAAGDP